MTPAPGIPLGISVLESSHAMEVLIYLLDHDGSRKLDLYSGVGRTNFISRKIDDLEIVGLVEKHIDGRSVRIYLTPKGRRVAEELRTIDGVIRSLQKGDRGER